MSWRFDIVFEYIVEQGSDIWWNEYNEEKKKVYWDRVEGETKL